MPVIGFDEGKNKEEVYKKSEVLPAVHAEFDSTINSKQEQHLAQTAILLTTDWDNNSQTVDITGVTANDTVLVSPVPSSIGLYAAFGIVCTAQGEGNLTFTCDFLPSEDISVNVIILGV